MAKIQYTPWKEIGSGIQYRHTEAGGISNKHQLKYEDGTIVGIEIPTKTGVHNNVLYTLSVQNANTQTLLGYSPDGDLVRRIQTDLASGTGASTVDPLTEQEAKLFTPFYQNQELSRVKKKISHSTQKSNPLQDLEKLVQNYTSN
ncbi:MAG: hypothetical protein ACMXYA_01170 [Candidatus Woesearchaeota archaeon]